MGTMCRFNAWAIALAILSVAQTADAAPGTIKGTVNAKSAKHRRNAVVFVEKAPWTGPARTVPMDQKNQVFLPAVLPVVKGWTVEFLNNDATGHNVFSPDGEKFDMGVFNKDEKRTYAFQKEGVYSILCKMHPSMLAYVISLQNPYFAVTGEDGSFEIPGVPPGEYVIKVWHERKSADPAKVAVTGGGTAQVELELH